jgi:hypothetical protein
LRCVGEWRKSGLWFRPDSLPITCLLVKARVSPGDNRRDRPRDCPGVERSHDSLPLGRQSPEVASLPHCAEALAGTLDERANLTVAEPEQNNRYQQANSRYQSCPDHLGTVVRNTTV